MPPRPTNPALSSRAVPNSLLPLLAPLLAPVVAWLVGASRRNRLRRRVNQYVQLANDLQEHDPESADLVRGLLAETVEKLVFLEQKALRRRFQPSSFIAVVVLVVPSVAVLVWAATWDTPWKWLVIVLTALWTVVWGGVGLSQLFSLETDEQEAEGAVPEPAG